MPADLTRAARVSLASQNHDLANMNAVISEAMAEENGLVRMIVALAGLGATLANRLSPDEPDAYLLLFLDELTRGDR
ncbi:hypothetical protein CH253_19815 [Rhodococcus sp. 06-156-3C]|nr:hypothetical protein CH280_25480 [Rhodococcus sp. 06-156-4C]OZD17098.1 hypothetical protein CH253_19815 [Rhodococcus sp. 06-156-3C]OZD18436.1 hypothetical protein CH248_16635 [Rhodococcus sp. 06-156-4a]OZD28363.1 hypothetical protein CH284_29030 [Rhodococcus sp. 06-156-3]OZD29868.1 hypothetical protein CH247_15820 [Rhodococcus sp. 06-156-3b]OZF57802.1 hypothetical protein CH290_25145 [Rhodococcus sp. 06-156-4]